MIVFKEENLLKTKYKTDSSICTYLNITNYRIVIMDNKLKQNTFNGLKTLIKTIGIQFRRSLTF